MRISEADRAILEAENAGALTGVVDNLEGYSGKKLIGTLQRLALLYKDDPTACYLEIGVFKGLTLLSVANAVPAMPCYGIDNFAFFDPRRENLDLVEAHRNNLGLNNVTLINQDYEDAMQSLNSRLSGRKIAVLFIDGPHDYRSQLMCLLMAIPHLHHDAVIVVDDSNYQHVRQANRDFLTTHSEFKLLFDAYTRCHPANMSGEEYAKARDGWWNGVNIIIRDAGNRLSMNFPPTERSRELFESDHILHASPDAELLPLASALLAAIRRVAPWGIIRQVVRIKMKMRGSSARSTRLYPAMNTYSEELPESRHHQHGDI